MQTHIYKNPDKYSKNNNLQFDFAMQVIAKMNPDMKDSKVLDIGCGDGRITFELAKLARLVVGTDISEAMIEYANKTYCNQCNLNFLQMDAANNIYKNQFDIITSFNCLHWVKNQEAALKGIACAATENAKIILLLSHRKSIYHFALDTVCENDKWKKYFKNYVNPRSFFDPEQYQQLLKKSGLDVSSIVEKEMTYYFNSIDALKDFLNSSMANIKLIPDDLKKEFLDGYCNEFFNLLGDKNFSRIPVSFWCLEIFATKPNPCIELVESKKSDIQRTVLRAKL